MSNNTSRIIRTEADAVDPIARQAKGNGAWEVITRDGLNLGKIARYIETAPNGRQYREVTFDGRFVHSVRTAIFLAAFAHMSPAGEAVDQTDYFAFIEGARLVKVA